MRNSIKNFSVIILLTIITIINVACTAITSQRIIYTKPQKGQNGIYKDRPNKGEVNKNTILLGRIKAINENSIIIELINMVGIKADIVFTGIDKTIKLDNHVMISSRLSDLKKDMIIKVWYNKINNQAEKISIVK